MASKRAVKRAQCGNKIKYFTPEPARREASRLRAVRIGTGERIDAYKCSNCGAWHVGHRPWKKAQAQIAAKAARRRTT